MRVGAVSRVALAGWVGALPLLGAGAFTPEAMGQLQGTVQQRSFLNPVTQQTAFFNIYLPPNYAGGTQRYPVIYHLHGLGGSQGGPQNVSVPASFEAAHLAGIIGPVIVVFPNGYADAWWADSFSGNKPAETDVLQLIEHVDATFRTIGTPGSRVVQGFSMGGFGTTKFYSKFGELFAACVEYDGAFQTWAGMQLFFPSLASSIFGNSGAYFDQYSPWYWTTQNAAVLGEGPPMRMVVGSLVAGNRSFRDHLLGLSIPVDYVETACGHNLDCLLAAQGQNSAAFIAAALDLTCAATVACYANCDCSTATALTIADFGCFQSKFAAGEEYADCDQNGSLTIADFGCFQAAFGAGCP